MQFPEHTRESYVAAARMGAGIVECDVTFTGDKELVCRHSQCDLHTTTNILATPLAKNVRYHLHLLLLIHKQEKPLLQQRRNVVPVI